MTPVAETAPDTTVDALADEGPIDVIIVETEDGTPRVAGAAEVLSEQDLARQAYDDFERVVARVPGVYARGEDGFGLRPNIGMRGANSDRSAKITLLEDGVPLAPAPYAAPAAYYFPLAMRLTGVEVFKGAASTQYGPQTIGGAVNVRTRPVPLAPAGAADLAIGAWNTTRAHAWFGTGDGERGVLFELAGLGSDGFKHLPDGSNTGFQRGDAMLKARAEWQGEAYHALELKVAYGHEDSDETYLGLSASDFAADPFQRYAASALDHMRWDRGQAQLSWVYRDDALTLRAVAYTSHLARAWTKLNRFDGGPDLHDLLATDAGGASRVYLDVLRGTEDSADADQVLLIGTNDRAYTNGGAQFTARHTVATDTLTNTLETGVRLHVDDVHRLHTEDPFDMKDGAPVSTGGPTRTILDSRTSATALAGYVHDDLGYRAFHVLPGIRVEAIRTSASDALLATTSDDLHVVPVPGVATYLDASDDLQLFAGVHRGFSPVPPGAPDDAKPELATSYEAGLRLTPREAHLEATGFLSDYANITGICAGSEGCGAVGNDQQFNGGAATIAGVEAAVSDQIRLPGKVIVGVESSYAYTATAFRTSFVSDFPQFGSVRAGDALPYVPVHQGGAQVFVEHPKFDASVALRGRSAMRDVAGQGPIDDVERVAGAVFLDLSGSVPLTGTAGRGPVTALYLNASNLVGAGALESMRPFGARPAAPTQVMIGVRTGTQAAPAP